ncbi:hypothetical protein DB30_05720 [Enhygromyxa salina]|uniref:Uncharacterized protein n=1 Tax=Enhygromyxa salina TaxID=215803 RepID=A0A0C1ZW80_9BACT|nr:hypothetical protein [Enhygromyxa salina]KIG15293.1 hypothetical protein DB30_05720 [Enhygromyxa salina]
MSDGPHDEDEVDEADESVDQLLLALADRARERPSAWDPVTHGERGVDEVAAETGVNAELARAYFEPFDAGETQAVVDAVLARAAPAAEASPEQPAVVVPLRPRNRTTTAILAVTLAIAAAAALWMIWPQPKIGGSDPTIATREPIPAYGVEVGGWLKTLRDDATPAPSRYRYRAETPFEWVLRPEAQVGDALAVRAFVIGEAGQPGRPLALDGLTEIASTGAIRIHGTIAQLMLAPGRYTIALVVGRPDALPERAAALTEPTDEPAWRVLRIDIDIEG